MNSQMPETAEHSAGTTPRRRPIGVAVVGFGWMGRVHSQAYTRVLQHFPGLGVAPRLVAVADDVPARAHDAAEQFGFARGVDSWRDILHDPEVEAVSITAPNYVHREIGEAMAKAGKHIWIEKPVGIVEADAQAVADAVASAGLVGAVGFNYRNAPAVRAARELIASGELGTITHANFRLLSDYAADPDGALSWRYEVAKSGRGVLGDLATHGVDLAWYLLGDLAELVADTAIFIPQRARPHGTTSGHERVVGGELGQVENEDFASALLRFDSGARASIEVSRVAIGEQNNYGFTIHGTRGSVGWDFRRLGELTLSMGAAFQDQPVSTVRVGPGHGDYASFQPGAAIAMGYDDLKVIEAAAFLGAIAGEREPIATLADAVRAAHVLDAMAASADSGRWVTLRG